ncbi:hypothetical protein FGO68_gene15951 [Halteria grandinella]|uniref:Uncharacterized protein n=1 Tax=Halteria grandinella TaxID=5974 RepID=A0A8J8T7T3_HALGN|nr:hypothetical protein FGO68_gene15951 [Halteria grandinella]
MQITVEMHIIIFNMFQKGYLLLKIILSQILPLLVLGSEYIFNPVVNIEIPVGTVAGTEYKMYDVISDRTNLDVNWRITDVNGIATLPFISLIDNIITVTSQVPFSQPQMLYTISASYDLRHDTRPTEYVSTQVLIRNVNPVFLIEQPPFLSTIYCNEWLIVPLPTIYDEEGQPISLQLVSPLGGFLDLSGSDITKFTIAPTYPRFPQGMYTFELRMSDGANVVPFQIIVTVLNAKPYFTRIPTDVRVYQGSIGFTLLDFYNDLENDPVTVNIENQEAMPQCIFQNDKTLVIAPSSEDMPGIYLVNISIHDPYSPKKFTQLPIEILQIPRTSSFDYFHLLNSGAPQLDNFTDQITVEIGHQLIYTLSNAQDPDNDTINCTFLLSSALPFTKIRDKSSLVIKPVDKVLIGTSYTIQAVLTDDNEHGPKAQMYYILLTIVGPPKLEDHSKTSQPIGNMSQQIVSLEFKIVRISNRGLIKLRFSPKVYDLKLKEQLRNISNYFIEVRNAKNQTLKNVSYKPQTGEQTNEYLTIMMNFQSPESVSRHIDRDVLHIKFNTTLRPNKTQQYVIGYNNTSAQRAIPRQLTIGKSLKRGLQLFRPSLIP